MQSRYLRSLTLVLALAAGLASAPSYAQSNDEAPPLIAGRLTVVEGDVQIWRVAEDGSGAWDSAQQNDVITRETGLLTGASGRAEIRVGPIAFRIGASSRGGFAQLDDNATLFNLERGVLNVRVPQLDSDDATAVTAGGTRVDLGAPGRYRIDSAENGGARVTAFEGQAALRASGNAITVGPGHSLDFAPQLASFSYGTAVTTGFDAWSIARDNNYREVRSAQYVSPWMTGAEDLDRYGDWNDDATYGNVWFPRQVESGWIPYRDGEWRWVAPWGWTWVDAAPWGFAPFHYGRWVTIGGRWGWWPGAYVRRPVYAPALVGFVGRPGWNVSVTAGGRGAPFVGWYPLSPWHQYRPSYTASNTYITVINRNVISGPPRGIAADNNFERGRTVVPGDHFARQPIMRAALPPQRMVPGADLQPMPPPRALPPRTGDRPGDIGRRPGSAGGATPPAFVANPGRPEPGRIGGAQPRSEAPTAGTPRQQPATAVPNLGRAPEPSTTPPAQTRTPRMPHEPQGGIRMEQRPPNAAPNPEQRVMPVRPVQQAPRAEPPAERARPAPDRPEAGAPGREAQPGRERAERPSEQRIERPVGERRIGPQ